MTVNRTNAQPYAQIVGAADIYIAAYGATEPAVNAVPGTDWYLLGPTDGDQSIEHSGGLTYFRDNDHTGPTKAVRPEEDVKVKFTLVGLTLENFARVLHSSARLSNGTSPTSRKMPLKRGADVTEYAILIRGACHSPYGNLPGQTYIPRAVSESEPTQTLGKDKRIELECSFTALEDDFQSSGNELGWSTVQTA